MTNAIGNNINRIETIQKMYEMCDVHNSQKLHIDVIVDVLVRMNPVTPLYEQKEKRIS